jgi:hypothetical protein
VRSVEILQNELDGSLQHIHVQRRAAVWRAVSGLLLGGKLWLTALGRALPGETSDKHRIKAADRLMGNQKLHEELRDFYRALARRLLRGTAAPVVAVDWSKVGDQHYMLSAQLCCDGRTLPLLSRVYPKSQLANRGVHSRFLDELVDVVPAGCTPILITDAGFHSTWFDAVRARGWHYIGRVRNRTMALHNGRWAKVRSLHALASARPRNLGSLLLPKSKPRSYRLVLSARPKLKGRKRINTLGVPGRKKVDRDCSKAAREPWLLATSLVCNAAFVVRLYSLRMQIEQSFRDSKSYRHGWALHLVNSKSTARIDVLLMLAALASVVTQTVGRAAARCGLQRLFQANTVRTRRVFSFFVLGLLVIRGGHLIAAATLLSCLNEAALLVRKNALS